MTDDEKRLVWKEAVDWERSNQIAKLFEDSDKQDVMMAVFHKASALAVQEKDPDRKKEIRAYSEGFRHAINIMKGSGKALETYKMIGHYSIEPSNKIELTDLEVRMLAVGGHL
jgi:hypothetical protein